MSARLHGARPIRLATQIAAIVAVGLFALMSCDDADRSVAPLTSARPTGADMTMGSGTTPTFLGQATYADIDKVKRIANDWHVELKAKGGLEVIVRSFAYAPGAITGWHKHPGPVLIQVIEGTVTFYDANDPNCTPIVVPAGHGYLDTGEGHIGRNLGTVPAKDITVYLAPPGTQVPQLRIDLDQPPQCGF